MEQAGGTGELVNAPGLGKEAVGEPPSLLTRLSESKNVPTQLRLGASSAEPSEWRLGLVGEQTETGATCCMPQTRDSDSNWLTAEMLAADG